MSGICGWVGDAEPSVLDAMLNAIGYRGDGVDLSGNGFNMAAFGNVTGAPDRWGQAGAAAAFDGQPGTLMNVTNPLLPVGSSARSGSVWVYNA